MKYEIVYADPPWPYDQYRLTGMLQKRYETMTLDELKAMNEYLRPITADNCALFMWVTHPMLREGLELIKAWEFEFLTTAFVWLKTVKDSMKFHTGNGFYTRSNSELVLLGRRGRIKTKRHDIHQLIITTIQEHSRKPDIVRKRIVELMGDLPRIELFARIKPYGWAVFGNDIRVTDNRQQTLGAIV